MTADPRPLDNLDSDRSDVQVAMTKRDREDVPVSEALPVTAAPDPLREDLDEVWRLHQLLAGKVEPTQDCPLWCDHCYQRMIAAGQIAP